MIKQNISKLLDTEMERKDFLKLVGIGAVAAVGASQIIKAITTQTTQKQPAKTASLGYGSSTYGGAPDSRS